MKYAGKNVVFRTGKLQYNPLNQHPKKCHAPLTDKIAREQIHNNADQ